MISLYLKLLSLYCGVLVGVGVVVPYCGMFEWEKLKFQIQKTLHDVNIVQIVFVAKTFNSDGLQTTQQLESMETISNVAHLVFITIMRPFDLIVYATASKKFREALKSPCQRKA